MPELPEVENIRRTLAPHILGRRFADVKIHVGRMIKYPGEDEFAAALTGRVINNLLRRGKYLLFDLDNNKLLAVHLRMTGALIAGRDGQEPGYCRIDFVFSDGGHLWYSDVRTLGTLHLMDKGNIIIKGLAALGPEPLAGQLELSYFQDSLKKRKSTIKGVLLDQAVIAGIGNIYADEALFLAGVRPDRAAGSLNADDACKLHRAVLAVIAQGIENRGTTFRDYKDGEGNKGSNQEHLWVYGRAGQPCKKCGTPLKYARVAGRGTSFCPACQI